MHRSRLCAVLIDCKTSNVDEAARFWGEALGRPVDKGHPSSRGNYRMLETPPDEPIVEVQPWTTRVRVHLDIETDDIPAEVARLESWAQTCANPPRAMGGRNFQAPTDQPSASRGQRPAPEARQFLG